mgnify:CR=1 FL=1|jgi:hypothetical protein
MKFWKDHAALRIVLMVLFFVVGLALVLYGWSLTGQMTGLILMLVGIILMLTTLLIYNQRFASRSK